MSSIGTGYDLAASTFSPDGRIFQVEYAQKAVENGGTVVGLRGRDGVVLAVEKMVPNDLVEPTSNTRLLSVTEGIGAALAGLYPDAKHLARWCTDTAMEYFDEHRVTMGVNELQKPLSVYVHQYTVTILRPLGCSLFLASADKADGPQLWMMAGITLKVDPAGMSYGYTGWAAGKHRQAAKTEIEKLPIVDGKVDLGLRDLVKEAAAIIHKVRDEAKDKKWRLELGWVGVAETGGVFEAVPDDVFAAAEDYAKQQLDDDDDDDE